MTVAYVTTPCEVAIDGEPFVAVDLTYKMPFTWNRAGTLLPSGHREVRIEFVGYVGEVGDWVSVSVRGDEISAFVGSLSLSADGPVTRLVGVVK